MFERFKTPSLDLTKPNINEIKKKFSEKFEIKSLELLL